MESIIDVNTGEVATGSGAVLLRSVAIGSCIVVVCYEAFSGIGGMAHIMLPGESPGGRGDNFKYAHDGIDRLFGLFSDAGVDLGGVHVCLVGAGNVLMEPSDTICESNIRSVKLYLGVKGIEVKAEVLGGFKRKSVFLNVFDGVVSYTVGDSEEKLLYQVIETDSSALI